MRDDGINVIDGCFLVIGCGSIGKRHLSNLKQLGINDIIAVDSQENKRREIAEKFGIMVYADLDTALNHGVQVALICTPTYLHLEQALVVAKAGCHLFIEKPISDTLDGVDELIKIVKHKKLVTLVGCNFRFHPGLRRVKALLDEKAIGKVVSARAQFGQYLPDWHPQEDYLQGYSAQRSMGGGVVLDRIHEFDYLRWLLGEVTGVYAMIDHLSHLEVDTEDIAEILLHFGTGVFGSIHVDYIRRAYDCSLEIIGDAGVIKWEYQNHFIRWYSALETCWYSLEWLSYDGNQMYIAEMRHFIRVLQGQEVSELDLIGARQVLSIALAAKQAAKTQKVVAI